MIIILDSDLHFEQQSKTSDGEIIVDLRHSKKYNVEKILSESSEDISAIVINGDVTSHGTNGKKFLCWKYGGEIDEFTPFLTEYWNPLRRKYGEKVFLIEGNHDHYVPFPYLWFQKPVIELIKRTHGGRRYLKEIKSNYWLISCGLCPKGTTLSWLVSKLRTLPSKAKVLIAFHFNVFGPYRNFWDNDTRGTDKESDKLIADFYQAINPYKSKILALLVGHWHSTYLNEWNGIPVISGAGQGYVKVIVDESTNEVSIEHVK